MRYLKFVLLLFAIVNNTSAQDLTGYKICIDPGHGGHDPTNDRYVIEADFWESESNLSKGLHLKEILESLGAQVVITRTGNLNSDDIALSQRAAIANNNNVDYFHSIHSNATGADVRVNYPLILFRGYTSDPIFPEAKTFASKVWRTLYDSRSGIWSRHTEYISGDWSFYTWWDDPTQGLGVLRPLEMPGTLSEGSFHDYIPEARRLKNSAYHRNEAWAIAKAFLVHYNAGELTTGIVSGIVRDPFETIPASLKPVNINEGLEPLNYVKVTLKPGNRVYEGDDQFNGYFMFDGVDPGEYTLVFEAEDYITDSTTVTVTANEWVFADMFMEIEPNYNPPVVTYSSPQNGASGVRNLAQIIIDFDISMNPALTQLAFTISPDLTGSFQWENNNKRMIFTPALIMTPGINYTVTLSRDALSRFNINPASEYSFSFRTRHKLNVLGYYPQPGEIDISRSVLVKIQFDAPLKQTTLPGNVLFYDESDQFIDLVVNTNAYAKGFLEFEPKNELEPGRRYRVILKEGVGDIEELTLNDELVLPFITTNSTYSAGSLIDSLENIGTWWQPQVSNTTVGIDSSNTSFIISTERKKGGRSSGQINYSFTDPNGICAVFNYNHFEVTPVGTGDFGMYVYGNLNKKTLQYVFRDIYQNETVKDVGVIDWTGWKMKNVNLNDLGINGEIYFKGVKVINIHGTDSSGTIYIDDIQVDFVTPVDNELGNVPVEYSLKQNYPNPFNPVTTIEYTVAAESGLQMSNYNHVSLIVYDILGRKVKSLVNGLQKSGSYKVAFDAADLNSGVYFYRLTTGNYTASRKMILLK
ncbi:MAG: N-acetylmuramoyl-L-alanine amidase [Melioribacteraceae bacterium]|nr:N-acetylmuramoyl-L-alanine amidase [Melioribacteraceae bacterium]